MIVTGRMPLGEVEEWGCECYGRNRKKEEVFDIPVYMRISISKLKGSVSVRVKDCPYILNRGCKAAHPHLNDILAFCPYVSDLPSGEEYLREHKKDRTLANKDLAKIASEEGNLLGKYKHLFV